MKNGTDGTRSSRNINTVRHKLRKKRISEITCITKQDLLNVSKNELEFTQTILAREK